MSQTERIHQIVHLLENSHHPVPIARFLEQLEISRATFKRDIEYLRDRLGAPISWQAGDADTPRGYVLDRPAGETGRSFGISGLWFNQSEIHALLTMHQLTRSMQPGLISGQSEALLTRITHLLGSADDDPQAVLSGIRILHSATRRKSSDWFEVIAHATVRRKRLQIAYYTRSRDQLSNRQVSPQRLLHYRENWYLLAWCHRAGDLRLFALDAIRQAELRKTTAKKVAAGRLDSATGDGFGIFGGPTTARARLRFSATAARWIADEVWHRDQRQSWQGEQLILEVPYSQPRELIMEILRHGRDVEVLEPPELRREIQSVLEDTLASYRHESG